MNVKLREDMYYQKKRPSKDEYWTVSVYKVEGERLKEEKEIDLFKVVKQFDPDYIPTELGSVYSWNGRELAALQIRSTKDDSIRKKMYLNLDTRKLERNESLENDHQKKTGSGFQCTN